MVNASVPFQALIRNLSGKPQYLRRLIGTLGKKGGTPAYVMSGEKYGKAK